MNHDLSSLLANLNTPSFKKSLVQNEAFLIPYVGEEVMTSILNLPYLKSLDDLLVHWGRPVQVHLPDLRDEASALDTGAQEAKSFYHQGMGLLFNEAHELSPMLNTWLNEIRKLLGLSALTYSRNLIYATPDGVGTAPHLDQNINLVLQVQGIKKWKVAKNRHLMNPMTRHTMGQPVDPEMMSYLNQPMPQSLPDDAQEYVLKPGSLLFVPRGAWHETEAEGDALALNFTFTAPTWIDLFSAALRSRLILSPEWRETADLSEKKFQALLTELAQDVPHWKARDILDATEG